MKELEEGFLEWLQERNVEEYDGHVWDKVEKIHGEERLYENLIIKYKKGTSGWDDPAWKEFKLVEIE